MDHQVWNPFGAYCSILCYLYSGCSLRSCPPEVAKLRRTKPEAALIHLVIRYLRNDHGVLPKEIRVVIPTEHCFS